MDIRPRVLLKSPSFWLTVGLSLVLTIMGYLNEALGVHRAPRAHWLRVFLNIIHTPALILSNIVSRNGNPDVIDPTVYRVASFFTYCVIILGIIGLFRLLRGRKHWWLNVRNLKGWTGVKRVTVKVAAFSLLASFLFVSSFIVFMYWFDDFRFLFYESGSAVKSLAGLSYHAGWFALLVMAFRAYKGFKRRITKKIKFIIYGVLLFSYLLSTFFLHLYINRFTNEPDGYMGIKWGTPVHIFIKPEIPPWLTGIHLTEIDYRFYDDEFGAVVIRVGNKEDWLRLKEYCFRTYGSMVDRGIKDYGLEHDYKWRGDNTTIFLTYWTREYGQYLAYYSTESRMKEIKSRGRRVRVRPLSEYPPSDPVEEGMGYPSKP